MPAACFCDVNMVRSSASGPNRRIAEFLTSLLQKVIDAEASTICNAMPFQRSGQRIASRAGTYRRRLRSCFGDIVLRVPRFDQPGISTGLLSSRSGDCDHLALPVLHLAAGHNSWSAVKIIMEPLRLKYGDEAWLTRLGQELLDYADSMRRPILPIAATRLVIEIVTKCEPPYASIILCMQVDAPRGGNQIIWFSTLHDLGDVSWRSLLTSVRENGLLDLGSIVGPNLPSFIAAASLTWPATSISPDPDLTANGSFCITTKPKKV